MGVSICKDAWDQVACMYDNTTGEAFGPVFTGPGAGEGAEEFLTWLRENAEIVGEIDPSLTLHNGSVDGGRDPRDWLPLSLRALVEHFQATVLDAVEGHVVEDGPPMPHYHGREPDGQRMEGGRIVPTDR